MPLARIPKRKSKHAAQILQHLDAVFFVEMDERFHIAVGREAMPALFEIGAQFDVVIDLAVADDVNRSVFVRDRLLAAREIDNAEPPHRQTDSRRDKKSFIIRPAMPQARSPGRGAGECDPARSPR